MEYTTNLILIVFFNFWIWGLLQLSLGGCPKWSFNNVKMAEKVVIFRLGWNSIILGDVGLIEVVSEFSFGHPKCHFSVPENCRFWHKCPYLRASFPRSYNYYWGCVQLREFMHALCAIKHFLNLNALKAHQYFHGHGSSHTPLMVSIKMFSAAESWHLEWSSIFLLKLLFTVQMVE